MNSSLTSSKTRGESDTITFQIGQAQDPKTLTILSDSKDHLNTAT